MVECHTSAAVPVPETTSRWPRHGTRVPDEALLDAARECVIDHGVRATTLTGIARTAGVSRMTIYRRFPDVGAALAALMTREFGLLLDGIGAAGHTGHARARLVRGTIDAVGALNVHPLLRSILDTDADMLVPYVVDRLGATQQRAETFLTELVVAGHADGSIRKTARHAQVRTVLLIAQSFTLSLRPATVDIPESDLLSELGWSLHGALRPERNIE